MAKTDETKFAQRDFSGGFNSNPLINENELQLCVNLDLEDFGKFKPALQDTLVKSITGVTNIQVVDGYVYYLVESTLSRVKDGVTDSVGTIGGGTFFVEKFGDIHIIIASDKVYKVIGTAGFGTLTLTTLGTAGPADAPTVALEAQKSLQIDDFEDHTTWTASGVAKADDAVIFKEGSNSMKLTPSAASTIEYVTKAFVADLTEFADGTESEDDDLISVWIYVSDPSKYSYVQIIFDINTGDFANDMFAKTIPIINTTFNSEPNEDFPDSFADPLKNNINWDDVFDDWDDSFSSNARTEFDKFYLGQVSTSRLLQAKQTNKKVGSNLGQAAWTNIKIRKSEFLRIGGDTTKGWETVAAVKLVTFVTDTGIDINFDDLKMIGGGKLDAPKYKISYSYVSKYTLADGTAYQEESQLSPEAEVLNAERQNIDVSVLADSADTQVTHKRIYIRGGGLQLRHRAGEIETGVTTFTTDKDEPELVIELIEDNRKNGVAPANPTHGVLANGKLFIAKGKNLSFARTLLPYAFISSDFITLPYDIKAVYKKGPNIAVLMENEETIYVNPGFSAVAGGYLFDPQNPQGCLSTRSAKDGYHLSHDGIVFYRGQDPVIISERIRKDLLAHSETFRTNSIGTYLKGRYYLCIPDASVMYVFDSVNNRFIKHSDILDVAARDGNDVFVLKSDGIYSFETDNTKRKVFTYRSPELVQPDDSTFHNLIIDGNLGSDGATVEYFLNDVSITSIVKTTSGRKRIPVPVSQTPGSRISAKISTSSETTNTDMAIFGVYLQ